MERVVMVDPAVHHAIERMTDEPFEIGGTLRFNDDGTTFIFDRVQTGQFARVEIPKGVVQFHTHTSTCRGATCTLGIPSVQDLVEFTRAFMRDDALIHCLYSEDGCYCISVIPQMARYLSKPESCTDWRDRTTKNMMSLYATLNPAHMSRATYHEFRDNWVTLAREHGLSVHRYDRGVVPKFCLVFTDP